MNKKLWVLFLLMFSVVTLSACLNEKGDEPVIEEPTEEPVTSDKLEFLDIYYLNDLHGAIEESEYQIGLAKIANFVNIKRSEHKDNTLFLAGGDMLQGSALSNYYMGRSTIEIMNVMGFDAMVVGNHEFDWGIDVVTDYFDGETSNGEANFPLLGANVVYEGTNNIVSHIEPYTIIEKLDKKIGIIGTMGFGLESSIAQSRIDGYEFLEPTEIIKNFTKELRTTKDVDIIIVLSHDPGGYLMSGLSNLTGDYKVDAVFNAHSHQEVATISNGVPTLQAKANGERVGYVRIALDSKYNTEAINYKSSSSPLFNVEDEAVKTLVDFYKSETDTLFKTPIITNRTYLSRTALTEWVASVMRAKTNASIAFHNTGGTRVDFYDNEVINLAKLYQVLPFDNVVKTVYLDGSTINNLLNRSDLRYSSELNYFESGKSYKVATNDYVFDKTNDVFLYGDNLSNDGYVLRDIVFDELTLQKDVYDDFVISNALLTNQTSRYYRSLMRLEFR